ncbi:ORF6N domain-containing protein [Lactiplantibacillus daowaiensis]|uniref:ORF6N domain-containing protein n=1 Tax=Lactiplantibacillus daowaiensis TaxID=2559918 RepID=A0ABW1RWX5_9LACO|nr:ORF6N domain-containing protein [Lactiplantibacillus daowaiensis]
MNELQQVKYNGDLILTTEQLAIFYETSAQQIQQNFLNNKDKFVAGTHYYHLKGSELKQFKNYFENFDLVGKRAPSLYLWTKQGAARHSKMLGTDKAWDMFDELEENYFNPKPQVDLSQLSPELQALNGLIGQMNKQAISQRQLESKVNHQNHKLDGLSDIISTSTVDWRNDTTHLINAMAVVEGNAPEAHRGIRNDIYDEVDRRGGVSLKTRLTNLRRRMADEGVSLSRRKRTTKIDVIAQDKKLIEIFTAIVKEYAIRYDIWNEEY